MQNSVLKVFALTCAVIVVVTARHVPEDEDPHHFDTGDYYWRNFNGQIPEDALPGGVNVHGHKTYIGQVLHEHELLPAKIDPHEDKVYFESGFKQFTAHKNIKILCTQNPEQFEWISSTHMDDLKHNHIVDAGYEAGVDLLVGRKQLPDELAVGKVVSSKGHASLNITKDGVCIQHGDFEILTYNPHIKIEKRKKHLEHPMVVINTIECEHADPAFHKGSVIINVFNGN